ncbi:hypothetical protein Ddc_20732 [Ditylenchus destructor]|nr:hypothetical protein Ddc_20732 [Ditylenchus destructor]
MQAGAGCRGQRGGQRGVHPVDSRSDAMTAPAPQDRSCQEAVMGALRPPSRPAGPPRVPRAGPRPAFPPRPTHRVGGRRSSGWARCRTWRRAWARPARRTALARSRTRPAAPGSRRRSASAAD